MTDCPVTSPLVAHKLEHERNGLKIWQVHKCVSEGVCSGVRFHEGKRFEQRPARSQEPTLVAGNDASSRSSGNKALFLGHSRDNQQVETNNRITKGETHAEVLEVFQSYSSVSNLSKTCWPRFLSTGTFYTYTILSYTYEQSSKTEFPVTCGSAHLRSIGLQSEPVKEHSWSIQTV